MRRALTGPTRPSRSKTETQYAHKTHPLTFCEHRASSISLNTIDGRLQGVSKRSVGERTESAEKMPNKSLELFRDKRQSEWQREREREIDRETETDARMVSGKQKERRP